MTLLLPYREDELADIAALVNSAYRGELAAKGWTSESYLLGGQRTDEASLRASMRLSRVHQERVAQIDCARRPRRGDLTPMR